jgi:hypothetical protein
MDQKVTDKAVNDEPVQEDDSDRTPWFIQKMIDDPPVLPGESAEAFVGVFQSFELSEGEPPTTDAEYLLVYQATMVTWELLRLERTKVKVLKYQGRFAAEVVYRKSYESLTGEADSKGVAGAARKWGERYFADPEYRKAFAAKLEAAGYGADAVEAEAFRRSLPSIAQIERLIASSEKRLLNILKRLDALRDPKAKLLKLRAALLKNK